MAHVFGRRAGLLGGLVLITMPQWFLVTHQTMTDMPFVAPMAAAMAMILLGAHTDPEEKLRVYEVSLGAMRLRLSAFHLVIGAVVACALPADPLPLLAQPRNRRLGHPRALRHLFRRNLPATAASPATRPATPPSPCSAASTRRCRA